MVETPKTWTSIDQVAMQRTSRLAEEWAAKHQAAIEVHTDEDVVGTVDGGLTGLIEGNVAVQLRLVERRYRVANGTPEAKEESSKIYGFIWRNNYRREHNEPAREDSAVAWLLERGYSHEAINEVLS